MEFFRPTWKKVLIAFILTIWTYVASFIFILLHTDHQDIRFDQMMQLNFWFHIWYWSPLYLIVQNIPNYQSNSFWQSTLFNFYLYPIVRFFIRYLVACTVVFFLHKRGEKCDMAK